MAEEITQKTDQDVERGKLLRKALARGTREFFPGQSELESEELPVRLKTVLLVEDEESVRELVRMTLEKMGYKVLEATEGADALKIEAAHPGEIDILISDFQMPGMSGRDLGKKLSQSRPQMKILYLSGYSQELISHQGGLEPGAAFLQKPFTLQALALKVQDMFQSSGS